MALFMKLSDSAATGASQLKGRSAEILTYLWKKYAGNKVDTGTVMLDLNSHQFDGIVTKNAGNVPISKLFDSARPGWVKLGLATFTKEAAAKTPGKLALAMARIDYLEGLLDTKGHAYAPREEALREVEKAVASAEAGEDAVAEAA